MYLFSSALCTYSHPLFVPILILFSSQSSSSLFYSSSSSLHTHPHSQYLNPHPLFIFILIHFLAILILFSSQSSSSSHLHPHPIFILILSLYSFLSSLSTHSHPFFLLIFILFRNIVVFRLVAYLLNMICLNLLFLYKIVYKWIFVYIWHNFISISRDRNIRYNFHGSRSRAIVISFQPTPFHFSFTVPLKYLRCNAMQISRNTIKRYNISNIIMLVKKLFRKREC